MKDPKFFLKHILDSIDLIDEYLEDIDKETFIKSQAEQDKIERRLEIIGEAITNLPEDLKKEHPEVPWRNISDTRNKLIHDYFSTSPRIVWAITQKDIPTLRQQMKAILEEYDN